MLFPEAQLRLALNPPFPIPPVFDDAEWLAYERRLALRHRRTQLEAAEAENEAQAQRLFELVKPRLGEVDADITFAALRSLLRAEGEGYSTKGGGTHLLRLVRQKCMNHKTVHWGCFGGCFFNFVTGEQREAAPSVPYFEDF